MHFLASLEQSQLPGISYPVVLYICPCIVQGGPPLVQASVDSAMHPGVIEEYLLTAGNLKKSRDSNRRANANRQAFIEDGREKAIAEGKCAI
jgi:hypothetical protein